MRALFLCDEFTAQRAREIGVVQEVVPASQQIARAMEIAAIIAREGIQSFIERRPAVFQGR